MNKKIIAFCSIALIAAMAIVGFSGCTTVVTTNPNGTTTTNKVVNSAAIVPVIDATVPLAVQVAISKDKNAIQYFTDATLALDLVIANGDYSVTNVQAQLAKSNVNSPQAQLAVVAGLSLYKSFAAEYVTTNIDKTQAVNVLQALDDSIKLGVSLSAPANTNGTVVPVKVQ